MANEEIRVVFGGELGPLASSLRSMKDMVKGAGESVRDSFKDAFKALAAPLSVAGIVESVRGLFEEVQNLKRISESTGLGLGITQDLIHLAQASGVASNEVEAMLDKFVKSLPPGSDPEQALYGIADKLKSIPDPAERAREAVEMFGRSGMKLLPVLQEGSDGVRKLADEWGRLSEVQIAQLEHANTVLEKSGNQWKVILAGIIERFDELQGKQEKIPLWRRVLLGPAAAGEALIKGLNPDPWAGMPDTTTSKALPTPADLGKAKREAAIAAAKIINDEDTFDAAKPQEKVLILTRQILALRREMEDTDDPKQQVSIHEKIRDITKQRESIEKDIAREASQQAKDKADATKKQLEASEKLLKFQLSQLNAQERSMFSELQSDSPSLQQLAQSGYSYFQGNQWKWQQGPFAQLAQRIMNLRADTADAVTWGDTARRDFDLNKIEELKKGLPYGVEGSQAEANGMFKKMSDSITKMQADIADLAARASGTGIKVTGPED